MAGSPTNRQIHGIDLIRFVSAAWVMAYHLMFQAHSALPELPGTGTGTMFEAFRSVDIVTQVGWVGVQVFFVISGFVIACTANGRAPLAFVISRLLRLIPAMLVCAAISLPVLMYFGARPEVLLVRVVKTFTFYPVGPYVGWQYWTLPVEVTFYAVVAMLLLLDWFRYAEAFACVLGLASAGAWLGAALAMLIPGVAERHLIAALQGSKLAQLLLLRHGIFFALGMMMWIWTRAGGNRRRVAVIGCLIAAGMIQIVAEALKLSAILNQPISIALVIIVWLTGIAAIAASIRFAGHDHSIGLGRLFRILGVASFPLYLLHMPLGMMIAQGAAPIVGVVAAVVAGILAVILLSIVVALYIEPPVRGAMAVILRRVETALVGWVPYVMRHSTPWCVHHDKPDVGATTMIMPSGRSRADESLMGSS